MDEFWYYYDVITVRVAMGVIALGGGYHVVKAIKAIL